MKAQPLIMNQMRLAHEPFMIDFTFTNNITILTGAAGTGKSMIFSFIKENETNNSQFLCLNYKNAQDEIRDIISETEGKLIVIDNADILLSDDARKKISIDDKNQYLIIGRNPRNLFATSDNFFELEKTIEGSQTIIRLKSLL